MGNQTVGLMDYYWTGLMGNQTVGLMDYYWTGLMGNQTIGLTRLRLGLGLVIR